jgi:acyl-CoA thioester hydrolase
VNDVSIYRTRVAYIDTDMGNVVHHSRYLRYLECARVEHMRDRGIDYRDFEVNRRLALPVVDVSIRYRLPARFDDELMIETHIGLLSRAKIRFDSVIRCGDALITEAQITLCCVRMPETKLVSMPKEILALAPNAPKR